ncbi:MAG: hypothetical protein PF904_15190 [Kiritimatiellae bacterium]|nr:hypothetical protein [Kiritimatiellia bacterium]
MIMKLEQRVKDKAPKPLVLGRHLIDLGHSLGKQFGVILSLCVSA